MWDMFSAGREREKRQRRNAKQKFKVTTQIQGDKVRVTSKSRDDLQAVIAAVRARDFPVALSFQNFRD